MNDHNNIEGHDEPEIKSKTQIKREMEALQKLGVALTELNESQFNQVPISETLRDAILLARTMKHREGRRRQLQFIGKLMRSEDHAEIEAVLEKFHSKDRQHTQQFHQSEQWRDKLITEGNDAFTAFINQFPDADRQHLRQLIRHCQKEQSQNKPPTHARKLFRYIRELIES